MKKSLTIFLTLAATLVTAVLASQIVGPPEDPFDMSKVQISKEPPPGALGSRVGETVTISQLDRSKFPIIEMYVDILDDQNNPIPGLTAQDFCVSQDGAPVNFQVTEVGSQGCPISVCLVIDQSGSMGGQPILDAKAGAKAFVDSMDIFDRVAVVTFESCVHIIHPFSSDKTSLKAAIDALTTPGATAAYDGVWQGLDLTAPELGSKAIIAFTDGMENMSQNCWPPPDGESDGTHADDSVIICDKANVAGIPIYSIGIGTNASSYMGGFCSFSAGTGGYCIINATSDQIGQIYSEIKGRLCSRYFITYTSPDAIENGDQHQVEVCMGAPACSPCDTASYWEEQGPSITADPTTQLLSQHCQMPNNSLTFCATVVDSVPPMLQNVTLFYRQIGSYVYSSVPMTNAGGYLYCVTLPGNFFPVGMPGIDYYITASDGNQTVSLPRFNPQSYPNVVTICPNDLPAIIHNQPPCPGNGVNINITASVSDSIDYVSYAKLYYRKSSEILFDSTNMINTSGNSYSGTIPGVANDGSGIDYMIRAWDNYGSMAAVGMYSICDSSGCFDPVDTTGLPYTILVKGATYSGNTVPLNTEIGVFDGNLCVGVGAYTGSWPVKVTAWEGDPGNSLPGFVPGHPMSFRYCFPGQVLHDAYIGTIDIGDGSFGYGSRTELYLTDEACMPIRANQWQWVSFYHEPFDRAVEVVFGSVAGLVQVIDDDGNTWIPAYAVNTIGNVDLRKGYAVFAVQNSILCMPAGNVVNACDSSYDLILKRNRWNLIPYILADCKATGSVFGGISTEIAEAKMHTGRTYIPGSNYDDIVSMCPSYGYNVFLNQGSQDQPFGYCGVTAASGTPVPDVAPASTSALSHFVTVDPTGLPYSIILDLGASGIKPEVGDEFAVLDTNYVMPYSTGAGEYMVVGATVYEGRDTLVITCWQGDPVYGLAGFDPSSRFSVVYWDKSKNQGYTYGQSQPTLAPGFSGQTFGDNNSFIVIDMSIDVLTGVSESDRTPMPEEFELTQNYPNPFNPTTQIAFALPIKSHVKLEIFNLNGRKVADLLDKEMQAGYHTVTWDARAEGRKLASGVYFYRLTAGEFLETKKMVLLK